jgi:hypothetical protein
MAGMEPFGEGLAVLQLPGHLRGAAQLPVHRDLSSAVLIAGSEPRPALIRPATVNLIPEPFGHRDALEPGLFAPRARMLRH